MSGLNQVLKSLEKMEEEILKSVGEGLEKGLVKVAKESVREAPLDKALRENMHLIVNGNIIGKGTESGSVNKTGNVKQDEKYEAHIAFGTDAESRNYALVQHEELSFDHPNPGTKAKYLEDPFKRNEVEKEIAKSLRKVLK